MVEEFQEWWEKKDKQQEELAAHDVPAYRTGDVEKKAQKLVEDFDVLRKTKKPKDPEEEKRKKEEKKKKAKKAKEEPVLSRAEIEERLAAYALEKTKAVEEEDFDAAQSIKEKMEKLNEQLAALPEGEEKAAEEGAGEGKSEAEEGAGEGKSAADEEL